jgi:hypothetical protein
MNVLIDKPATIALVVGVIVVAMVWTKPRWDTQKNASDYDVQVSRWRWTFAAVWCVAAVLAWRAWWA